MIPEELLYDIIRGAFMLGTAKLELSKVTERVKGVPAEQIPGVLDEMYAESVKARDEAIAKMPEDPA